MSTLGFTSGPATPADLAQRTRAGLDAARANVRDFRATPAGADYASVVGAFDQLAEPIRVLGGWVRLYSRAHPDAAMRAAAERADRELRAFGTEQSLDRDVYAVVARLDELDPPTAAAGRVVELALRDYRRSGIDRDAEARKEIEALRARLVEVGQQFDRNIIEDGRTYVVAGGHAALAGCPDDLLAANPERAVGSVELNTDPATRLPLLTYAENRAVRRGYFLATQQRAAPENLAVLDELLALRSELASKLGYASWADYATEDKMSGSPQAVRTFLEDLAKRVEPRAREELEQARIALNDPADPTVRDYDRLFLVDRVQRARSGVDSRELREFFEYGRVRDGLMGVASRLFEVDFQPASDASVWHPSVEAFDVRRDGRAIGRIFLDMHPREDKFKHACLMGTVDGIAGRTLPEGTLLCNFPEPPANGEGTPALLTHDQVTTFFHEFGHLLHHLLAANQPYASIAGISTEWDFVEVPSQMLEEWAWDADVLQSFARHFETDEPIALDVVRAMRSADEFGRGLHMMVQIAFGMLSLELHEAGASGVDTTEVWKRVKRDYSPFPFEEGSVFQAAFGHLHSYSALYYTYLWSLSIAKDFFGRFEGDLFAVDAGRDYRQKVLEPGGSADAVELVGAFLGRESNADAFERWLTPGT